MPRSALQQATVQSAVLNVSSSLIAQLLKAYRSTGSLASSSSYNPLGLEWIPVLQFLIICLLVTPPNFMFQQYLEQHFPGYIGAKEKPKLKSEDEKGTEKRLDVKNTTIKFFLDQTIGSWLNNAFFIMSITVLRGGGLIDCIAMLEVDFWPIQWAAYKLWPAVSLFNFLVVPSERRVVVGSAVGLFWNIFMVLRMS